MGPVNPYTDSMGGRGSDGKDSRFHVQCRGISGIDFLRLAGRHAGVAGQCKTGVCYGNKETITGCMAPLFAGLKLVEPRSQGIAEEPDEVPNR